MPLPKRTEIRIAGLGGQGVVLAGHILGKAAVYDGLRVVQTQSYGAEARGSLAKSEVIVSDGKIGFPMVRKSDVLVALSQTALDRHLKEHRDDGIVVIDASIVHDVSAVRAKVFTVEATRIAEAEFKSRMYANMVMLGAVTKITKLVTAAAVETAIRDMFKGEAGEKNVAAFKAGLKMSL